MMKTQNNKQKMKKNKHDSDTCVHFWAQTQRQLSCSKINDLQEEIIIRHFFKTVYTVVYTELVISKIIFFCSINIFRMCELNFCSHILQKKNYILILVGKIFFFLGQGSLTFRKHVHFMKMSKSSLTSLCREEQSFLMKSFIYAHSFWLLTGGDNGYIYICKKRFNE